MNIAVFFDLDGVIIEDKHLLSKVEDINIITGVPLTLKKLKNMGFKLIVISNQAIIARGIVTKQEIQNIHSEIENILIRSGGVGFDGFYFCPHHDLHCRVFYLPTF